MRTEFKYVTFTNVASQESLISAILRTARECLCKSGINFSEVGMLISTSIYNEEHMCEPAFASTIQDGLSGDEKETGCPKFSFDLLNGGGGILNAFQVIDSFIQTGQINYGLVVSGDIQPKLGSSTGAKVNSGAGAALLGKNEMDSGIDEFSFQTFSSYKDEFQSSITWPENQLMLSINLKESYVEKCVECAYKAIIEFERKIGKTLKESDLILCSQSPIGFKRALLKKLFKRDSRIDNIPSVENHTSGLLSELSKYFRRNDFADFKQVILLSVGAGIQVSMAMYHNKR